MTDARLLTFDRDAFANEVNRFRREICRLSMDEAAASIGVITKAQLFRAEHRRPINIEAFLIICEWMRLNPRRFLINKTTGRSVETVRADVKRGTLGETNEAAQLLPGAAT